MQTFTLRVDDTVSEKLMWFLSHFDKSEVEIIESDFLENQNYLKKELSELERGAAKMVSEEDFWNSTEETLRKYED